MRRISMDEWTAHLQKMILRVAAEWPEIEALLDDKGRSLHLACPDGICRARLGLDVHEVKDGLVPTSRLGGSPLGGDARVVLHGARRYLRLSEALLTLEQISANLFVEVSR